MKTLVLSTSSNLNKHLQDSLGGMAPLTFFETAESLLAAAHRDAFVIVHLSSVEKESEALRETLGSDPGFRLGIATDRPSLTEFLNLSNRPLQAYFHSYMSKVHYLQLYQMVLQGMSWFHPDTLNQVIGLARKHGTEANDSQLLGKLSKREQEVALLVREGMSNSAIAERCGISERTVKAHLGHIFRKLEIPDRLSLALALR